MCALRTVWAAGGQTEKHCPTLVFEFTRGTLWAATGHNENKCETPVLEITRM